MADLRKLSPAGRRLVAASLPENRAERGATGRVPVEHLMGSEDVEPGLERGDGFFVAHEVRVTEPWHQSEVQLDERPRVRPPTSPRTCKHCGRGIRRAVKLQRFHTRGTQCYRDRVRAANAARKARSRAA